MSAGAQCLLYGWHKPGTCQRPTLVTLTVALLSPFRSRVPSCDSPLRIAKFTKPAAPPTTGKFRGRRDSGVDSGTATRPRQAPPPSLPLLDTQTVLFRTQQQRNYEQPAVAAAAVKATVVVVAAAFAEAAATSSSQCVRVRVSCRLLCPRTHSKWNPCSRMTIN